MKLKMEKKEKKILRDIFPPIISLFFYIEIKSKPITPTTTTT